MTFKASDIVDKLMGAGMLMASVGFFANIPSAAPYIIPGLLFGAGGVFLALRPDRHPPAEVQAPQRLDELAERLAATQLELTSAQERIERLEDERDFMRQLATPAQRQPAVPPPPLPQEVAQPRIPEVNPPPAR